MFDPPETLSKIPEPLCPSLSLAESWRGDTQRSCLDDLHKYEASVLSERGSADQIM